MHLLFIDMQLIRGLNLEPFKKIMLTVAKSLNLSGYTSFYKDLNEADFPKDADIPVCLDKWIQSKLSFTFPVLFERSRIIVRLFEVIQ
jgi:hypothetical protein